MKKYLINSLIIFLLFLVTFISVLIPNLILDDVFDIGISKGIVLLAAFIVIALFSGAVLIKLENRIGRFGVLTTIILAVLFSILPKALNSTLTYSLKFAPYYLSIILGIAAGYFYAQKEQQKLKTPILLAIFPIIMSIGIYSLWIHKIEYGNWKGETTEQKIVPFELINKAQEVVNNESLKGKIILFDFWFISCPPYWVKFPDVQLLYDKYQSNPLVEIYAVNRPMPQDKPYELFSRIEERGYTFPVLQGNQKVIDALNVNSYPTVMLLNQKGEIIFMGELEDAEKKIETILESIE